MIELVMTVCLLAAPGDCRKERLPFDGSLITCATAGQIAAADWITMHPKWRLTRWACGLPSRDT